jgi:hypothetical protein
MDYPVKHAPSSRQFDSGDFPVKQYKAQDGMEVRILYGSKRTGQRLTLEYAALPDVDAEEFVQHYIEQKGTFGAWAMTEVSGAKRGWGGDYETIGAITSGNRWRYENPPRLTSVYPGVSNVSISLVAVLVD